MKFLIPISILLMTISCVPVPENNQEEVVIDIANEDTQKIYSLQNRQKSDSLKYYFSHKNATLRYLAAMAFASIQSDDAIDELASLLFDKNRKVRTATAYAMGQIGNPSSVDHLLEAFDSDIDYINSELNMTILEAVGKCGDREMLDHMATTTTYTLEDNNLLLGQARGIYRFALRGLTSQKGTQRMSDMVINDAFPVESRIMAANYLYRAKNIDISDYKFQLLKVLNEEGEPLIRMCLGSVLAKIDDNELYTSLLTFLNEEEDYRVKVNTIKGFANSNEPLLVDSLLQYVEDSNEKVAIATLSVIYTKAARRHTQTLRELSNTIADSQIRSGLLRAALASAPFSYRNTKALITNQIIQEYNRAGTDYNKVSFLSALSADPSNYQKILDIASQAPSNIIQSLAIASLSNICSSPNFKNIYRTNRAQTKVKEDILQYIRNRIIAGDIGEISASGEFLMSQADIYKNVFTDSLFLINEINKLIGSESIEAKKSLQNALSFLTSYSYEDKSPPTAKELNWARLKNISSKPLAIIVTTKGKITVELSPNLTPGTVANFIELTDNNFYDRKFIHRVVPNFVIQGGCPRGDGYGSLDYTIRSELPNVYYDSEGYIGMASAGIHTESTQWFITHSSTPHLDGKYTIFGKVSEGMDVVHKIDIGDIIQDIRILKYN